MPLTPFHYAVAYAMAITLGKKGRKAFPELLVGNLVPDLEVPLLLLATGGEITHLVLHSLIGGLALGVPLTLAAVWVARKYVGTFAGKSEPWAAPLGVLSHIAVDALHHDFDLLWPIGGLRGPLIPLPTAVLYAPVQALFGGTTLILCAMYFNKGGWRAVLNPFATFKDNGEEENTAMKG